MTFDLEKHGVTMDEMFGEYAGRIRTRMFLGIGIDPCNMGSCIIKLQHKAITVEGFHK